MLHSSIQVTITQNYESERTVNSLIYAESCFMWWLNKSEHISWTKCIYLYSLRNYEWYWTKFIPHFRKEYLWVNLVVNSIFQTYSLELLSRTVLFPSPEMSTYSFVELFMSFFIKYCSFTFSKCVIEDKWLTFLLSS